MPLTKEQAEKVKEQLLAQIEKGFPDNQKDYAKKQIQEMNPSQLEEFLKQNNLGIRGQNQGQGTQEQSQEQCIFCSIIKGKLPSYKIDENSHAIGVLDIRPASHGHTLILPKEHIGSEENIPKQAKSLAKEISERIKSKLKPEKVEIENSSFFGHEAINLIPKYKNETPKPLNTQRKEADETELLTIQKKLKKPLEEKKQKKEKKSKTQKEEKKTFKAPKRIP